MRNRFNAIFNYSVKHVCELALIICLLYSYFQPVHDHPWERIIKSDGLGYYSYLPAAFIYHDFQYSFTTDIVKKHPRTDFGAGFTKETENGKVNKYFVGLSILWFPFFLIAHFLSFLLGYPTDGYSLLYQILILLSANFYLWLGCRYTRKLILEYPLSEKVAAVILLLTVFGTNLFFYVTVDSALSHAYSFAIIAACLYFWKQFLQTKKIKNLYLTLFLFGLVLLIRPTNIVVCLMFLFFAGNLKTFWDTLRGLKIKEIIVAGFIFLITIFPQFLVYYLQTGHFIVWSYGDERFFFDNPQLFNVLFSYQKGLFIYTPLVLVALFGLIYLFKNNKFQFTIMCLFLFLSTYIISSWWCWYYGASLGLRAFIDYYSILALLMTFLYLNFEKTFYKKTLLIIAPIFIIHTLILMHQYRHSIISWASMNKQKFWFSFLKISKDYEGLVYSDALFSENEPTNIIHIKTSQNKFVCSERNAEGSVVADKDVASSWETFNMISLSSTTIALKSEDGAYVSSLINEGGVIRHSAKEIKEWETFQLVPIGKNVFLLKACNNKYIRLSGTKLFADADNFSEGEHFTIIKL